MKYLFKWFRNLFKRSVEEKLKSYTVHTDGSFTQSFKAYGGYCALVSNYDKNRVNKQELIRIIAGGVLDPPNCQHCELVPILKVLEAFPERSSFLFITDALNTIDFFQRCKNQKGFYEKWITGELEIFVANRKILTRIKTLMDLHEVEFMWCKSHIGSGDNELCDELAKNFCARQMRNKKYELFSDNDYAKGVIRGNIPITKPDGTYERTVRKDSRL